MNVESEESHDQTTYTSLDLELLHHYSTVTFETIMFQPRLSNVWRDTVFNSSSSHLTLRTSLLTTAAMQLIITEPNHPRRQEHIASVTKHKDELVLFLIAILKAPSPGNCIALMSSLILLLVWGFAARRLPPELGTSTTTSDIPPFGNGCVLDNFLKIASISHGVVAVAAEYDEWLQAKGLSPLSPDPNTLPPHPRDLELFMVRFEDHLKIIHHLNNKDNEWLSTLENQRQEIRKLFRFRQRPEWYDLIVGWSIRLPRFMVQLLKRRDQGALIVMAHWASCLLVTDERWWIHGWSGALFMEISQMVDEPWKQHLAFPRTLFEEHMYEV